MNYKGSCHCGKVQFEADMVIESGLSCNCSICHKRGSILAFTPAKNFKLIAGEELLTHYKFNKKVIDHQFCSVCGILPFAMGKQGDELFAAINIRCLEDVDLSKLDIKHFDGRAL